MPMPSASMPSASETHFEKISVYIRQWHPTPVLLPGKSHGWMSLEVCSPWGRWGSDTTERLHFHFSLSWIGEGNGNALQCSCQENPRDGGAWFAAICGVTQSQTRLKRLSSSIADLCVQQKLTQPCKAIIFQLKKSAFRRAPWWLLSSLLGWLLLFLLIIHFCASPLLCLLVLCFIYL